MNRNLFYFMSKYQNYSNRQTW